MLTVENLFVNYGMIKALQGISLVVKEKEIVALIGNNGAGKTTTLKTISGLIKPTSGRIYFQNIDLIKLNPYQITKLGIIHIPEGRKPFANLTVYENLRLGAYFVNKKREIEERLSFVFQIFPRLKERLKQPAGTLSGGELQMLAIGRGLMAKPKLLLLDEPSMGLSPILVEEIFSVIKNINKEGTAILLIEQNAAKALSIAHRAYVLETGKIMLEGKAEELINNESVKKIYLGVG
ncbi:MAG: ABC transporter ATP-binding protein [candidate division WOR-3 bacterium]|nr:ABC transporter ATP-binding protein [candidate division WOR-3 bacterium]MCX7837077.1 ABC transporter ATP-binding protein [candidate division WOR-3 bacterium]MDW8114242.1 ABC transporter ATP-binding protein [candidate division WOR-3 bacterium]